MCITFEFSKTQKLQSKTCSSFIPFKNYMVNISLFVERRPRLNFKGYLTFKLTFKISKPDNFGFYSMEVLTFETYSVPWILFTFCF